MKKNNTIVRLINSIRKWNEHFVIALSYLFCPVSLLLRLCRFRVLEFGPVIGNICTQVDAYVKEQKLGRVPRYLTILYPHFSSLVSSRPLRLSTVNNYLFTLWKQYFWVITNPLLGFLLRPILSAPWLQIRRPYFSELPNESFYAVSRLYYAKYPEFSRKNSVLKFPDSDLARGWACLQKLGLSPNDWFVCFYARETGYYNDWDTQGKIRNVDVATYKKALLAVTEKGGWCIRIGSSKQPSLPEAIRQLPRVVDYSESIWVSDFMDVFLLSTCRFALTCSSGISLLPGLFGVPILMTNVIPLHVAKAIHPKDITILKRMVDLKEQRDLTFREAFSQYVTDQPLAYYYDALQLGIRDNTEEEIFQATKEMLERLEGTYREEPDDGILQERFHQIIPQYLFCKDGNGKIGYHFLKTHSNLLCKKGAKCEMKVSSE